MKQWKRYNELTETQKLRAREQYLDIRNQELIDEGSGFALRTNVSDETMECLCGFEIDTEDEFYIFVNI